MGLVVELEATAPIPGLQDTGTGRNRVPSKPSGASRLTINVEQKPGHFRVRIEEQSIIFDSRNNLRTLRISGAA